MYSYVKRTLDFMGAVALLILAGIPMLVVAAMIKLEDGGPVFFMQQRIGKNLKPFYIYKFRSMRVDRKALQSDLTHNQMVTKVGKFIRATSLDELPQLFNVLKGEMSFIGPRPWIREYYSWFTKEQKRRSDVLPGISGLAQVKGRNGIDIVEKINYDLEYVNTISFKTDVKIVIETIKTVFSKEEAEISEKGIKEELNELKEMKQLRKAKAMV